MKIIPAIDLIDGKCVRLTEGDFDQKTTYNTDPVEQAFKFKEMGATHIHLIDLDGALGGISKNKNIIKQIKRDTGLHVQTGGGIRTEDSIKELIYAGIDKVILGTILAKKFDMVKSLMNEYGDYFLAGVDIRDGFVKTDGWKEGDSLEEHEFGKRLFDIGFKTAIYTDISRDGKLKGPNIDSTIKFSSKTELHVILSGGISSIEDVEQAITLKFWGLQGIIVGKAYYEGKIDLVKAINKFED